MLRQTYRPTVTIIDFPIFFSLQIMSGLIHLIVRDDANDTDQVVQISLEDALVKGVPLVPEGNVYRVNDSVRGQQLLTALLGAPETFEFANGKGGPTRVILRPGDALLRGLPIQRIARVADETRGADVLSAVLERKEAAGRAETEQGESRRVVLAKQLLAAGLVVPESAN